MPVETTEAPKRITNTGRALAWRVLLSQVVIAFTSDHAGELPPVKKWLLYNVLATKWMITSLTPVFWALAMAAYARTNSLRVPREVVRSATTTQRRPPTAPPPAAGAGISSTGA